MTPRGHDVGRAWGWYARCMGGPAMFTFSPAGSLEIVSSLAAVSSTIVVAVLVLGLLEERFLSARQRRVARDGRATPSGVASEDAGTGRSDALAGVKPPVPNWSLMPTGDTTPAAHPRP
jgi:hypothetical protein